MGRITLKQAAQWCGGKIDEKYAGVTFFGATNDSRNLEPGQLFVVLQGVRDGHEFIPMAFQNGAAAVLCQRCQGDYPAIIVEDTRLALGQIAREHRKQLGMQVVGVTGSVGKSTTKEMIACVLAANYMIGKTPVNHNNDIGMPMAVLAMEENTQIGVLEMGMNHFGEIAYLSSIALPDAAVIINIGTMHIEHLGSQEGILEAKLEILQGMQHQGRVFLNGDDDLLKKAPIPPQFPLTYFGKDSTSCQVVATDVQQETGCISFTVNAQEESARIYLPLEGEHYVADAMAAVAVGLSFGISLEKIRKQLSGFTNLAGRQEILEHKGMRIIKDCYNAGPESMAAALKVLKNQPGRRIAVLGDMLELGSRREKAEHYKVGRLAAQSADIVLAYGPNGSRVVSGAVTGGMKEGLALCFEDREQLVRALKRLAKPADVLLFKGSHGMHMELALEMFIQDAT